LNQKWQRVKNPAQIGAWKIKWFWLLRADREVNGIELCSQARQ
jgi:hypothetical protein